MSRTALLQLCLYLILGGLPSLALCGFLEKFADSLTRSTSVEEECHQGNLSLCTSAGNMYRYGYQDRKKDRRKAIEFYRVGCSGGETDSCHALYEIGFDHRYGKGAGQNVAYAAELFGDGCNGSGPRKYSGAACHELAKLHLNGNVVAKDISLGQRLLHRGCERHSRRACRDLGNLLYEGRLVEKNVPGAVQAYKKGCAGEKKEPAACTQLGLLYARGQEVEPDIQAAERYLIGGCTFPQRIGTACFALAKLYDTKLVGRKSPEEITDLYHVACHRADSQRVGDACIAAAKRHLQGLGAEQDDNWVSELYSRGCQLRHRESCRLSCEWTCDKGQPYACAAVKAGKYPLGASNCFAL